MRSVPGKVGPLQVYISRVRLMSIPSHSEMTIYVCQVQFRQATGTRKYINKGNGEYVDGIILAIEVDGLLPAAFGAASATIGILSPVAVITQ